MLFPDAVADIRHSGAHGIPGILLPIYTIIDMIETAENVWLDSCVCAMVDKSLSSGGTHPGQPDPSTCRE